MHLANPTDGCSHHINANMCLKSIMVVAMAKCWGIARICSTMDTGLAAAILYSVHFVVEMLLSNIYLSVKGRKGP